MIDQACCVYLRQASEEDAEIVAGWRSEESVRRYQPLHVLPLNALRTLLQVRSANVISPTAEGEFQWIVETSNGLAGWISLTTISREHGIATIGYTIGEAFRGQGYATAAVRALLPIAFDPAHLDLARLEAVAAVGNIASRKVLERTGFRYEGIARAYLIINGERVDHARYALLRAETIWRQCTGAHE
ncbi:MAG: GNAT family N-acetyltransferase [Thermomicrobiales bacterium]